MKFSIERSSFVDAIGRVLSAVESRTTLPILSNVLIAARRGELELSGTNLDQSVTVRVAADVETPGSFTVPARRMAAIAGAMAGDRLKVGMKGTAAIAMESGGSQFVLNGLGPEEFPALPGPAGTEYVMDAAALLDAITKTAFAISKDETRYVLNGIRVAFHLSGKAELCATDGRRLAVWGLEESHGEQMGSAIIPASAVRALAKILPEAGQVGVWLDLPSQGAAKQIFFEIGGAVSFSTKGIEGNWPNFRTLIQERGRFSASLGREALIGTIRRAYLMSDERHGGAVEMELGPSRLRVSASMAEIGEADETIGADYSGDVMTWRVNAQRVLDPLLALSDDRVIFEWRESGGQIVMKSPSDEGFLYLLIPMVSRNAAN